MAASGRKVFILLIVVSLCAALCGGCSGLKYHNIYMAAAFGAAVGAIVGHQSDECAAGAGIGAAAFAAGEFLRQVDELDEQKEKEVEKAAKEVARGDALLDSPLWQP
jgi:sugar (pentulose or hexulose) kinase